MYGTDGWMNVCMYVYAYVFYCAAKLIKHLTTRDHVSSLFVNYTGFPYNPAYISKSAS